MRIWFGCTIRHKATELRATYEGPLNILSVKFDIIDKNAMCCGYPTIYGSQTNSHCSQSLRI